MLRCEFEKCRDCKFYIQTWTGKRGGVYGRCNIRYSHTDTSEARQGGAYACVRFERKEQP